MPSSKFVHHNNQIMDGLSQQAHVSNCFFYIHKLQFINFLRFPKLWIILVLFWNPKESDFTMLLKEFQIVTVLIISVASVNGRFNEVQKKFKELGYNVQFQMVIKTATFNLEYRSLGIVRWYIAPARSKVWHNGG